MADEYTSQSPSIIEEAKNELLELSRLYIEHLEDSIKDSTFGISQAILSRCVAVAKQSRDTIRSITTELHKDIRNWMIISTVAVERQRRDEVRSRQGDNLPMENPWPVVVKDDGGALMVIQELNITTAAAVIEALKGWLSDLFVAARLLPAAIFEGNTELELPEECPICSGEVKETNGYILPCKHGYHRSCIAESLFHYERCPMCAVPYPSCFHG